MSIAEIKLALEGLAGKSTGDLIRASDWNALVTSVIALGDALDTRVTGLETFVGNLEATAGSLAGRVAALEARDLVEQAEFAALAARVAPLLEAYRLSLSSPQLNYVTGQQAVVSASVRTLDGAVPNPRPWVDFVVSAGRVSADVGFTSRPGAAGNSVSVQVDPSGIARVRVSSEYAAQLAEVEEVQVGQFLMTQTGGANPKALAASLLDAATPNDTVLGATFEAMKLEYEQPGVRGFKKLADQYYAQPGRGIVVFPTWNDHRTTLVAYAKADADPTTPDQSRGVSSIQLTFRDWIGPFIDDYLVVEPPKVLELIPFLESKIDPDDYRFSLEAVHEELLDRIGGGGALQRVKNIKLLEQAVDGIGGGDSAPFVAKLRETTHAALTAQQAISTGQNVFMAEASPMVLSAMMIQATHTADVSNTVTAVSTKVSAVEASVGSIDTKVTGVTGNLALLNNRMNQTEGRSLEIHASLRDISAKVGEVSQLDESQVRGALREIDASIGVLRTDLFNRG